MSNPYPIEVDPITLQEDLQDRMKRYLLTALPINRRFPKLRGEAARMLEADASLIKGPYLEALPDFPKGKSLKGLVEEGVLHSGFSRLDHAVYCRPLHEHQEGAIRKIVVERKNLVVATGTGSGKTECFLFPMLDELLKVDIKGRPGVRAILVYPLNALANDQLYARLVPVLAKQLAEFGLTIGRYTGQTSGVKSRSQIEQELLGDAHNMNAIRSIFGDSIPANWLLSRQEMLDTPPHVLVTNYAMMEHLLLLPRNARLFKDADIRFIVLDEVHMYSGAQATEVALLLRKLRNRYAAGRDFRAIGTSATLGNTEEAKRKVIAFATRLFGAGFSEVVTSDRLHHHLLRGTEPCVTRGADEWIDLHQKLMAVRNFGESEQLGKWLDLLDNAPAGEIKPESGETLAHYLCRFLSRDHTVHHLARDLSNNDRRPLADVAADLFPEAQVEIARQALRSLVAMAAFAREEPGEFPLLPARYHLFTRGIEEATVELQNDEINVEQVGKLRFCREFRDSKTGMPRYRLMTCRKCGELYFEAFELGGRIFSERPSKHAQRAVYWCRPKDELVIPVDADEEEADRASMTIELIHIRTGDTRIQLLASDNPSEWISTHRAEMTTPNANIPPDDRRPLMTTCHACGSRDASEIVTPFHPGDQALSSTICEVLYAHLPTSQAPAATRNKLPGHGRNLLVFSDNRQDAAFFAPNFQRTHEDVLVKREMLRLLKAEEGYDSLVNIAGRLGESSILKTGLTDENGASLQFGDEARTAEIVAGKLFREFATPGGSRQSLEELGLVEIDYSGVAYADIVSDLGLDSSYGKSLVRWIIDSIRLNRAIDMPKGIIQVSDFVWGAYNQNNRSYLLEGENPDARFRFISRRQGGNGIYLNRYVEFLRDKLGLNSWESLLARIWEHLTDEDGGVLKSSTEGELPRVMNYRKIRARLRPENAPIYRCDKCGKISNYEIAGRCTQWKCGGRVQAVGSADWRADMMEHHYHYLYNDCPVFPSALAREHTAALTAGLRETLETRFKERKLNILSSSTTMEVGIDLGDLEGVFLRNVPPDISNYQQRAGRAGRRAQAAPVSITYARNRRYDQDVYDNSSEFLNRSPRTPSVHLGNPRLLQRHQFSILVSQFLAYRGLGDQGLQIGQLFGLAKFTQSGADLVPVDPNGKTTLSEADESDFIANLAHWLDSVEAEPALGLASELLECLKSELSSDEYLSLSEATAGLRGAFIDSLENLVRTFGVRFRHYMESAVRCRDAHKANQAAKLENDAKRWANQPIVNYLSKYGVIPTYSFPIDNIELQVLDGSFRQGAGWTTNSANIELSRDARIGIQEYAPGAEVVANGRVWTSAGIAYAPRQFMPTCVYKSCVNCNHIESRDDISLLPENCSSCEAPLTGVVNYYKEPRGFITSAHEPHGKEPDYRRKLPPQSGESQLIANAPEHRYRGTDIVGAVWVYQSAQEGRMIVVNKGRGRGFRSCKCGWAFAVPAGTPPASHRNPYTGIECKENPSPFAFHLAHTFHTDVLQIRIRREVRLRPETAQALAPEDLTRAREGVARSIAESVRLAACELLEIPEMELDATYRWKSHGIEIILYDSVSGGAGYCKKIFDLPLSGLLEAAKRVLECFAQCSMSCSRCLRSYSNQAYWEEFRRLDALTWVKDTLAMKTAGHLVAVGATEISLQRVRELCSQATRIILIRHTFGDLEGPVPVDGSTEREAVLADLYPGWGMVGAFNFPLK